jgi:ABC-type transport system involved in multi-copper enzyme maturation permease subunit
MFTLIKRELESVAVFLLLPLLVMAGVITLVFADVQYTYREHIPLGIPRSMVLAFIYPFCILPFFFGGLGSYLMQSDRTRQISRFLVTLAMTRNQIMMARFVGGIVSILILLTPLAIAEALLLRMYPRIVPYSITPLLLMFGVTFLANVLGFTVGLCLGQQSSRIIAIFGMFLLLTILLGVVLIQGFVWQSVVILLLLTTAGSVRTWQTFSTTSI